jgi:hypothetical protein
MKICHLGLPLLAQSADDFTTLLSLRAGTKEQTGVSHLLSAVGHRNVSRMEALVQGLVEESVQEPGWKFDDDIKAALNSIRDMFVKNIQHALKDQHKEDQEHMSCFTQDCFGGCTHGYEDQTFHCDSMTEKCDGLMQQHVQCRTKVYGSYVHMAQRCGALHSFILGWDPEVCEPEKCLCPDLLHCHRKQGYSHECASSASDCPAGYGSWLKRMIEKYQTGYEEWQKLYGECKTTYHAFLTLDMECDATQKGFEQCQCDKNRCHWTSCNVEYERCQSGCWARYEELVKEKECLEKDRKIDWSATKKIECYIDILLHDYTKEELLMKCGTEDCINKAREVDYKHCSTICLNVDHDGQWPSVLAVTDLAVKVDGHEKRTAHGQYHLGDGDFKCDFNGDEVFTKHRGGGVNRHDEERCTEHLDIDYQIPLCTPCKPPPSPVCDAAFHKKWYAQFDDVTKITEISDCCVGFNGGTCFHDVILGSSSDGLAMDWITVTEHSHAWAYNRCPCHECAEGYPVYPPRPEGQTCGRGAHTIDDQRVPGWKLVFRETYPFMFEKDQWSLEPENAEASNFAMLDKLEFLRGSDGSFEFKMSWPGSDVQDQIWKQTSNPVTKTSKGADGYEAVTAPHSSNYWGGLEHGGTYSLLDGSVNHNNWYYSVGSFRPWSGGIPGPAQQAQVVELYTKTMIPAPRMHTQEKTWTLLCRNTNNFWFGKGQWRLNEGDRNNDNFAILDQLEEFRDNGAFEFKLVWPGSSLEDQHWSQTSNPVTVTTGIKGYKAISAPHTSQRWGGLEHGGTYSLLDGSVNHGNWFYSVGSFRQWSGGIPGPSASVQQTELWVLSKTSATDVDDKLAKEAAELAERNKGKTWHLVCRNTNGYWFSKDQWSLNSNDPSNDNYAILDKLEDFRRHGAFEFKLVWPQNGLQDQHWTQTSNPVTKTSRGADGYRAISAPHTSQHWAGLEYGGSYSLLDGSVNHGNWFYSVGSFRQWSGGIPGPSSAVSQTELWVFA